MTFNIRLPAERRLSLKIIAGKLRRKLPPYLYNLLLSLRYYTFPKMCNNKGMSTITYSDGSWATRKTTADLRNIEAYLTGLSQPCEILQIGVGNSSLYATTQNITTRFVGITIAEDEIRFAREKFPADFGTLYDVRLMNKYSNELLTIPAGFDFIVDNDLSSYACCHQHFAVMLDCYRDLLKKEGAVLVGHNGLGYFDSGFGLSPARAEELAKRHGLSFERGERCYFLRRILASLTYALLWVNEALLGCLDLGAAELLEVI